MNYCFENKNDEIPDGWMDGNERKSTARRTEGGKMKMQIERRVRYGELMSCDEKNCKEEKVKRAIALVLSQKFIHTATEIYLFRSCHTTLRQ